MAFLRSFFSSTSADCRFTMLQIRAFHNIYGSCLLCPPFTNSIKIEKFSQMLVTSSAYTRFQPKVIGLKFNQEFYPPVCHWSRFLPTCAYNIQAKSILDDSYAHRKRFFCKVSGSVVAEKSSLSLKDGGNQNKPFFRRYKKHQKGVKTIAAQKNNLVATEGHEKNCSSSSSSTLVNSGDKHQFDEIRDSAECLSDSSNFKDLQKLKAKGKRKQQSRSLEDKEKRSGIENVSEETVDVTGSKKGSQSKNAVVTNNNKSPTTSEKIADANTPTEACESKTSTDNSITKPTKPNKRGKPNVKAVPNVKPEEETISSSNNKSKPKSKATGKSKTIEQLYPPTAKSVMVVESAAKANVIQKYLGGMFEVLPSYGHVRDLARRSGSVRPDKDFSMKWEVPPTAWTHLKSIEVALRGAKNIILASDPDREGEAIAWHIIKMLQQQRALRDDVSVSRVVFNEITESSIKTALQAPRAIDVNLVHAYLARCALDYLIGFNISPLLWRKLPGCRSAGRVQSAALSLICEREKEIEDFKPQEYWKFEVEFTKMGLNFSNEHSFPSHLTHFNSTKLDQLSIATREDASNIEGVINSSRFEVVNSNKSKYRRNPPSPYRTSTLQQDAANKLHFPTAYTMKLAQKLYEGVQLTNDQATGLITYMRTDGLNISDDAAKDIQSFVRERYGNKFASKTARKYFKTVKNAQEAHEAIRPTDVSRLPSMLKYVLDEDCLKLYTLIWSRTVACQMEPATSNQIQIEIATADKSIILRSSSSKVSFLGYQAVFKDMESDALKTDDSETDNNPPQNVFDVLGALKAGNVLNLSKIEHGQHYTKPPTRYNEGSLVNKLEELGIGRPSTYATTIKVLKDRDYVTIKCRVLYPEFRGRIVSAYLSHYFSEVTEYSFTADMETELDNVSAGLTEWKGLLSDYWTRFSKYCERAKAVHIHQVEKMLEKAFGDILFVTLPNGNRTCPSCSEGTLIFKVSRFGAGYFIGCDQHPSCKYIAKTLYNEEDKDALPEDKNDNMEQPKLLGLHPSSADQVLLKNGPYGYYVQLGEDRPGYSPKRASVSQIKDVSAITMEDALNFLKYPVTLGKHPVDGHPIIIVNKNGGFAIKYRRTRAPVPKNTMPCDITLERALKLLEGKNATKCGRPAKVSACA